MKTIREIAEEIGVTRQRVYRYIKKHYIQAVHQIQGVMYCDEAVETQIKQHFSEISTSRMINHESCTITSNDTIISIFEKELAFKNQIINEQQQTIKELIATIKIQAEKEKHQPARKVYKGKKRIGAKAKSVPIERLIEGARGAFRQPSEK